MAIVETYEVTETMVDGVVDDFEQTSALVEKLGLEGQTKFLNSEKGEISPFRKMTAQEAMVYGMLLSETTDIKNYTDSIIPLRVLQIANRAIELGTCDKIVVWHRETADIKDPLLVGTKQIGNSSWNIERFILARWGEELTPFTELIKIARDMYVRKFTDEVNDAMDKLISTKKKIESMADNAVITGKALRVSLYIQ